MQSDLGIIAITLISFGAVIITIKLLINGRIWKRIIDNNLLKENVNLPDLNILDFNRLSWLKWGIVITGFSISLILINIFPVDFNDDIKIGIVGLFIGASFIASYFISEKLGGKK